MDAISRITIRSGNDTLTLEKNYITGECLYTFNNEGITKEESDEIVAEWWATNREIDLIL